jgi:hypothetical protein
MAGSRARNRAARPAPPPRAFTAVYLGVIVAAVAVCYARLAGYFFAQDDFILLERAAFHPAAAVFDFFSRAPGHFRPLTKGAYFVVFHRVFDLNATPYHVFSLLVHALNALLVWRVLRRLRVGELGALFGAAAFALSAAFFHVMAWISCIQQLLGAAFILVALTTGIAYLDTRRVRDGWVSLVAYALALASLEQTAALPLVLAAVAWLRPAGGRRLRWREIGATLWPHAAVMAAYLALIFLWKTLPGEGDYDFRVGGNVVRNLVAYLGWSLDYHMVMPQEMAVPALSFRVAHGVLIALVAYHLARRRWRDVVFGLGTYLAAIAPVAFLENHTFYLHTYVPAIGIVYLVARAAADLFAAVGARRQEMAYSLASIVLVAFAVLCYTDARRNENIRRDDGSQYRRSFVIRRAVAAGNTYEVLRRARGRGRTVDAVYMVYGRTINLEEATWNQMNVQAALGNGTALRLFYDSPDLGVGFLRLEEFDPSLRGPRTDVFFHDDIGHVRTRLGP